MPLSIQLIMHKIMIFYLRSGQQLVHEDTQRPEIYSSENRSCNKSHERFFSTVCIRSFDHLYTATPQIGQDFFGCTVNDSCAFAASLSQKMFSTKFVWLC